MSGDNLSGLRIVRARQQDKIIAVCKTRSNVPLMETRAT